MTWVANELILEGKYHFFLECMRIPPEWYIWVYYLGDEAEAEAFQVTVTLFREDEYGRMNAGFSAQRSYTGPVSCQLFIYIVCFIACLLSIRLSPLIDQRKRLQNMVWDSWCMINKLGHFVAPFLRRKSNSLVTK